MPGSRWLWRQTDDEGVPCSGPESPSSAKIRARAASGRDVDVVASRLHESQSAASLWSRNSARPAGRETIHRTGHQCRGQLRPRRCRVAHRQRSPVSARRRWRWATPHCRDRQGDRDVSRGWAMTDRCHVPRVLARSAAAARRTDCQAVARVSTGSLTSSGPRQARPGSPLWAGRYRGLVSCSLTSISTRSRLMSSRRRTNRLM